LKDTSIELSVLVPCLNEALNIPEVTARIARVFEKGGFAGEIILVNDGSTDGTALAIQAAEHAYPDLVRGFSHAHNRGIAAAWQTGVDRARGRLVSTLDADLQYQPEDLLRLRHALHEHGVDIVQGWRSAVGREKGRRYYLSRCLNGILNGVFSMRMKDNKSGFILCRRDVFCDVIAHRATYTHWQSFIMVAARAKGYTYREVETLFEGRRQGVSFLEGATLSASAATLVDVARAVREYPSPRRTLRSSARWRAYMTAFDRTHWIITRDVEREYDELTRTQWFSASRTRELQDSKLRRLIEHAYAHVPYYRARMQALKLRPEDIRGQADIHKLPLLSKDDVREHLHLGLLSDNHDKREVLRVTTSGSTGEPLTCYADRAQLELRWAATLRAQEGTGYRFGDRTTRLWHEGIGLTREQRVRERADALLANRTFIPVFGIQANGLAAALRSIQRLDPVLLDGYAEALDLLAHYLKDHGEAMVRPRAIMSSAQTLPLASRRIIEGAFACKVFDKYGAREFSGIAYECDAHAGHHVVAEAYIVEILANGRPARPGEIGEVVITDLTNRCLPFIRYRIGDLAEAMDPNVPCPCGRGAPRVGEIAGRVQSIIQGTDGQFLPGTFFAHYLKDFEYAIRRFQVVQEERGSMRLHLVKGARYSPEVLEEVLATFRRYLGRTMLIDVEVVDDVPIVRTGKRVATVSRVGVDFQAKNFRLVRADGTSR
jgi:phenylacetate-CoA ligase